MNLKQLEKNTAAAIFETGLIEIGIGLVWTVSALAMLFDNVSYYIDIFFIVPIVFIILAIRYIARPRMGMVKFSLHTRSMFLCCILKFLDSIIIQRFW